MRLSVTDCVIPYALVDRFDYVQSTLPIFGRHKNIVSIYLSPNERSITQYGISADVSAGPYSAFLRFYDTKSATVFSDVFIQDIREFGIAFQLYPGTVWLYLDDYQVFHAMGLSYPKRVFFRADISWLQLEPLLQRNQIVLSEIFVQRYSECVVFFFGSDSHGNIIFSMLADWELPKIHGAVSAGKYRPCSSDRLGGHPWHAFRDVIASVTENVGYGSMDMKTFLNMRII